MYHTYVIPEEINHSFLIVEQDPIFCEDAKQMVEHLAHALKLTSRETTILLYAPALDPHLKKMTELADRVFCIYEGEKPPAKWRAKMPGAQATLEAYS